MEISLKELKELTCGANSRLPDKDYGWIVLILRNGFVFVGDVRRRDGVGYLKGFQVRYWGPRDGGLPKFASAGRIDADKIDPIDGELEFIWGETNVIGVLPCGPNWKK